MADVFVMPKPSIGQIVVWSYNKNAEKNPAVVTRVGRESIGLLIHVDALKDHVHKTGVRYVGDPLINRFPEHDSGHWDFSDDTKAFQELQRQVTKISAALGVEE